MEIAFAIVEQVEDDGTIRSFWMYPDPSRKLVVAYPDEYEDPHDGPFHFLEEGDAASLTKGLAGCRGRRLGKAQLSRGPQELVLTRSFRGVPAGPTCVGAVYSITLPKDAALHRLRITGSPKPMRQTVYKDEDARRFRIYAEWEPPKQCNLTFKLIIRMKVDGPLFDSANWPDSKSPSGHADDWKEYFDDSHRGRVEDFLAGGRTGGPTMKTPTTSTLTVLFMDLAGWSKLTAPQITAYLEKALPKLAEKIKAFHSTHLNTWGDAVVATFTSAVEAANCALDVRDLFRRTAESDGVPRGLTPRISLHLGEVIIAMNPLLGKQDIFGEVVHLAARLEPVTARGQVFCTEAVANALKAVEGNAPAAHPMGEVDLPKGFGRVKVFVVTGPNEDPPPPPSPSGASSPPVPPKGSLSGVSARPAFPSST